MNHARNRECDVLIAGGGAVGSALACALAELPLSIVLVEARDAQSLEQPSFDARVTALANGSQQILAGLELWPELRRRPIPEDDPYDIKSRLVWGMKYAAGSAMDIPEIPLATTDEVLAVLDPGKEDELKAIFGPGSGNGAG